MILFKNEILKRHNYSDNPVCGFLNHEDEKGSNIKSLKETGGLSGFAGTITESF